MHPGTNTFIPSPELPKRSRWQRDEAMQTYQVPNLHTDQALYPTLRRTQVALITKCKLSGIFAARNFPLVSLDPVSIVPTQNWVHAEAVDALTRNPDLIDKARKPALAVEHNGMYFLYDGHHRLAATVISGLKTFNCRVISF